MSRCAFKQYYEESQREYFEGYGFSTNVYLFKHVKDLDLLLLLTLRRWV